VRQLHVLGVSEDGTTLLLGATARSGKASHRIRLDDRLRAAVRGQLSAPGSDRTQSALPPKEIQARLRAGATPDEVAKAAGVPVARVLPYFAPVEAERERIIGEARRATVHRHRGPDATAPLGETVDARLREVAGLKDESVEWTARRRPDGAWVVALSYSARGGRRSAEWLWQPAGRSLTALDSSATRLAVEATPTRKRPARKVATSKAGPARPAAKKAARPKKAQAQRRPAVKKAVAAPAPRPRPAAAPKPAPAKRAVVAKKAVATSAKAAAPAPRVAAAKKAAPVKTAPSKAAPAKAVPSKAGRPAAAKKVAAVKQAPTRKPAVKKPAASRKPAVKKTRERTTAAPRFTLVPPPADTAPVQEPEMAPPPAVVPVAEPAATPAAAAAAPAAAAATEAEPPAPRRKPGTRVPLPSWSEVLLGVGGSSETSDASRRGN
jgi:hypothetical protein